MDAKEFIELIFKDEKLKNSTALKQMLLSDTPIVSTAAQVKRPAVPQPIKDMKAMAYREDLAFATSARIFFEQGKFMENYTDDFRYDVSGILRYYPTYNGFSAEELRAYFTWRTLLRNGENPRGCTAFAFMYIYELINGIGVSSPEEGYKKLVDFTERYGETEPQILYYCDQWLFDYVVYYKLPPEMVGDCDEIKFDKDLIVLSDPEKADNEALFGAIKNQSGYNIEKSSFYKTEPEDMKRILCDVYTNISRYYEKHRKNTLAEHLFGKKTSLRYYPFKSAVFYDRYPKSTFVYEVDPVRSYRHSSDIWYCEKYYCPVGKNADLGEIVRSTECFMRERYGYRYRLKPGNTPKLVNEIIKKAVDALFEERERNKRPVIEIDVSKLSDIRRVSEKTRDKLIVDEAEQSEGISPEPEAAGKLPVDAGQENTYRQDTVQENVLNEQSKHNELSELTPAELSFLNALLNGGDAALAARESGTMPSLLADAVNEKLFDRFSDNVIDFEADIPYVIEDYIEELKALIVRFF